MEVVEEEFEPPATEYFKVIERLEKSLDVQTENYTDDDLDSERM